MEFMLSQELYLLELVAGQQLGRLASPRPAVKEIPAPAFGGNQHVIQTLAMRVAVKLRVLRDHAQNRAGIKLVFVREPDRDSILIQVVRGWLRNQRVDTSVLYTRRKRVDGQREDLLWRENELERRERAEPLLLGYVVRPRQTANRVLLHVVLKDFREEDFVGQQRSAKVDSGCGFRDAHHGAILSQHRRDKILQVEIPFFFGRLGLDGRQSAGKTSQARVIRCLVNRERLHGIRGHRNRKAPRHRIGKLRRIDQKQALIFVRTFEAELSIHRSDHARGDG